MVIVRLLDRLHSPSDPDDKGQFRLSWHIVVSHFAGSAAQTDFTPVHLPVLLVVLLSPLVDQFPGHFASLRSQQKYHPQTIAWTTLKTATFSQPNKHQLFFQ